jgi:hypothetical protein
MRTSLLLLVATMLGGCGDDVCANVQGTCVALHISGNGSVATVQINATGLINETSTATGDVTALPVVMPVRFHAGVSGPVGLDVIGTIGGSFVGEGTTTVQVIDGQHTTGAVILGGGNSEKADAGATFGDFGIDNGGGGSGGTGGGTNCNQFGCPSGQFCDTATGSCKPSQVVPPGSACKQDGTISCGGGGAMGGIGAVACAPDNICRFTCGATADCTASMPKTECLFNYGGAQKYCTTMCDPMNTPSHCPTGYNCDVVDYGTSTTDCLMLDGKNLKNAPCTNALDCAQGYGCYVKAGQLNGTCYAVCMGNLSSCTGAPAAGQCQVPTGQQFGVCCPSGSSCL